MTQRTLRERFQYHFDNLMTRRALVLIPLWLLTAFVLGALFALLLSIVDQKPSTLSGTVSSMWQRGLGILFIQTQHGNIGIEVLTLLFGVVTLFVGPVLAGLVIIAAMKRVTELVNGRSVVIEQGHTVILGWSDQIYPVIASLVEANKSRGKSAVAILAEKDQTAMHDLVKMRVGDMGSTRLICRNGSPIDADDIKLVNLDAARSIIVPSPDGPGADKQVIKTLLAVTNSPGRAQSPCNVVACVTDSRNNSTAKIAGGAQTIVIDADDITAKLVVQTARQSGLSAVYSEILDYAGDEIYIVKASSLAGKAFGEALLAYDTSAVMGLLAADGTVRLKPPMSTVIAPTDKILALSADEDKIRPAGQKPAIVEQAIAPATQRAPATEKTLLLGWNRRGRMILRNLDSYLGPQSTVHVVAGAGHKDTIGQLMNDQRTNIAVSYAAGDTSDRETLEGLGIDTYDHVIVLASDGVDAQEADASTLVTLLHMRDMQARSGQSSRRYSIVSEMLDDRNRRVGQLTQADDFVVSPKLISRLMTQLSENRQLADVFADLFGPEGAEIYLKPAEDYVGLEQAVDLYTVVEAARRREEVAIGYRISAQAGQPPAFGVVLNPDKKKKVTFKSGDKVIVLADS